MEGQTFEGYHADIMKEIQEEWKNKTKHYLKQNNNPAGIRSSQISALVGWMIKRGIITPSP